MIIDSHVHLGRNEHINTTVDKLLPSMDKAKIDKALVFAGELNAYPTYTMLEEIKHHRDRLYGVASWDFSGDFAYQCTTPKYGLKACGRPQVDNLCDLYLSGDIVAVKFYTGYYHYTPNDLKSVLYKLNQVGCPAIFHMGDCLNSVKKAKLKYAQPLLIDEVAVDFPDMNFIIAHMGYPWVLDTAEVCYKNANVFTDISGFVYGDFSSDDDVKFRKNISTFLDVAGSDKLLFGTDWPISNQDAYVDTLRYAYDESLRAEAMTQNIIRAFKLKENV